MSPFRHIGNVPFDLGVLSSVFPENKHITDKARRMEESGSIIRLKKGMYVASAEETGKALSLELIANHLYGPSYVGREYALRYYGLIPERVYLLTSVTTKHSREFSNKTGNYSYYNCPREYFPLGLTMEQADGVTFLMASREKALCDVINYSKNLCLRSMKDVEAYLEEDIRFDTDELGILDVTELEEIAKASRKQGCIDTLIKYIKNERHIR